MLPHAAPKRSNSRADSAALERLPGTLPRLQRDEGQPIAAPASPGSDPGLSAPKGKHGARSRLSVLAGSGSHPACRSVHLVKRPHVVCVDRAAGIVALFPFHAPAVPLAAANIPPHLPNPSSQPLPAAFCGRVPRLRRDPRPQNAVPYSTTTNQLPNQDPHTPRLLDPAYALRINQSGVRYAHVRFELPPLGLMVPPRGPPRRFCCGAAARAGERLQNKAGEVSPDPSYCAREACRRRNPPQTFSAKSKRYSGFKRPFSGGRRSRSPAICDAVIGRARGTGLLCAGVVPIMLLRNVPGTPWKSSQVPSDESPVSA